MDKERKKGRKEQNEEELPDQWKVSIIVLVQKKGWQN
jgi:hypothetical protein